VEWYLANETWVNHVLSGEYKHWVEKQYTWRSFSQVQMARSVSSYKKN
jgi:dTDP-glucose 4,6-dehydratase